MKNGQFSKLNEIDRERGVLFYIYNWMNKTDTNFFTAKNS